MALIQFKRGVLANRGEATNGLVYFATDTKELFMADASGWKRYGDGDKLVSDVTYSNGVVTVAYNDGTTSSTFNVIGSVSDSLDTNQFVTDIYSENGVAKAHRTGITSSQVTRTATADVAGTTVEAALANLADAIDTGGTGSVVTVEEVTTGLDAGILKAYKIWQGSTSEAANLKGTINIPKDLVVTAGSVVNGTWSNDTFTEGSGTDKALKLTIANQTAPVYINPSDFIDVYTGGDGIDVSNTNEISVDLATNSGLTFDANDKLKANVKSGDSYIEIDSNGAIASKGIDSAISTAVNTAKNAIDAYTVNDNSLSNGNWQVDGGDINVDDSAATPETIADAISRLDSAAGAASDKVDTEIAKLNGDATASGTASAASGVTKTSYINVLNKVDETSGKVNAVGSGSTQTAVDVAGAANAAYTDAVSYIDTAIAGLGATVTDSCDATAAAVSGVTKTSYVSVANGVTVVEADGELTNVTLDETSVDAAGAANAAYTDAVSYTDSKLTWIEA